MDGRSPSALQRGRLCCHCLLVETVNRLVLVDTGFGLQDVRHPRPRLSAFFLALLAPDLREAMTAVRQVERLGFRPSDVSDIVLTHLDFDHAGGLDDFPAARVHLMEDEQRAAERQRTWLDRQRYRPPQWGSRERWRAYAARDGGDRWFGFDSVRSLAGLDTDLALVPLPGHTLGHAAVAVRDDGGWLLQAGDAYFDRRELDPVNPRCTPGLRMYQTLMEKDRRLRLANQARLRAFAARHAAEVRVCCAHDPVEFERLAGRPLDALAAPA